MEILNIYQKSLINFYGKEVRTPAIIDITNYKKNDILLILRKWGITDYKITTTSNINIISNNRLKNDSEIKEKKIVKNKVNNTTKLRKNENQVKEDIIKKTKELKNKFLREKQKNIKSYNFLSESNVVLSNKLKIKSNNRTNSNCEEIRKNKTNLKNNNISENKIENNDMDFNLYETFDNKIVLIEELE